MLKLPHLNGNFKAQNFVTKFHKNLFSHSRVMCTRGWTDGTVLKGPLEGCKYT